MAIFSFGRVVQRKQISESLKLFNVLVATEFALYPRGSFSVFTGEPEVARNRLVMTSAKSPITYHSRPVVYYQALATG